MGAAAYLSFVLLVFCLVRAAGSQIRGRVRRLDPHVVPESVCRAARELARGLVIDRVSVAMDGPGRVRYLVSGRLPDGRPVRLEVPGDGAARWLREPDVETVLPGMAKQCLRRCLPSFRPDENSVRLAHGGPLGGFALAGPFLGENDNRRLRTLH